MQKDLLYGKSISERNKMAENKLFENSLLEPLSSLYITLSRISYRSLNFKRKRTFLPQTERIKLDRLQNTHVREQCIGECEK
jgi:hypothetical protein